jgi:hypothetical protein
LEVLQVTRLDLNNGRFTLINKIGAARPPTTISNIHFHINNFNLSANSPASDKFLHSDDVVLRVTNQEVLLPNGIHKIGFKNLVVNVKKKAVQVDSCVLQAGKRTDKNALRIFFDVLKMSEIDFDALYRNVIKADSVYCMNPDIAISLDIKERSNTSKKSLQLDKTIQEFTGDLSLGYVGIQNAKVNVVSHHGDVATTFRSENDNIRMLDLRVHSDSAKAVSVSEFAMVLRNYETYSRDSSILYRFDSIRFINDRVRLSNFTVQSIGPRKKNPLYYSIPAFELTGVVWEDFMFNQELHASKATLYTPQIQYTMRQKTPGTKTALFKIFSGVDEAIRIQQIEVVNGTVQINLPQNTTLNLQQVDLLFSSKALLQSRSFAGMQQAIDQFAFSKAVFETADLYAELSNLRYSNHFIADALYLYNRNKTFETLATGIRLNDLVWDNDTKAVVVDGLGWEQARISVKTGPGRQMPATGIFEVTNLAGNNTDLRIENGATTIHTHIDRLQVQNFLKTPYDAPSLNGFEATGRMLQLFKTPMHLSLGSYRLSSNEASEVKALLFYSNTTDSVMAQVPHVRFNVQFADLLQGRLRFSDITAMQPYISIKAVYDEEPGGEPALPEVAIAHLTFSNPHIAYSTSNLSGTTKLEWHADTAAGENTWQFTNVETSGTDFSIDKATLAGTSFLVSSNGGQHGIDSGRINLEVDAIKAGYKNGWNWTARLQEAYFKNPKPELLRNNSLFTLDDARFHQLNLSSENKTIFRLLQGSPQFNAAFKGAALINEKNTFRMKGLRYVQAGQTIAVDSFRYAPAQPRDSFKKLATVQTEYMDTELASIVINNIDLAALERDTLFKARSIAVDGGQLNIFRDKGKPLPSMPVQPLPVHVLAALPLKLAVDTVALNNGAIAYTERNGKTGEEGIVTLNRIDAQLFPVRNIHIGPRDSLSMRAEGYLMDQAWMRLRVQESFTDSLGTFAMSVRMKPADLSVLNPALIPLVSVKFLSGTLDTVMMRATGNEYMALGEMKLFYKDLKVKFLKRGSETKKSLLAGLVTFAANNFVLKRHNTRRSGTVYFPRNRERSIFNFFIKMAFSGVASSVGAKKNKGYYRNYQRDMKRYNLPPVDFN